jgi:hypothetical protein
MKHSTFFIILAFVALVFGLGFILAPAQSVAPYGVTLGEIGQWMTRYLGSAFLGLCVLAWSARNIPSGEGLRAIMLGFFVVNVTGLIVALMDVLYGVGNALTWLNVGIYLFFTLGIGYFRFVKSSS